MLSVSVCVSKKWVNFIRLKLQTLSGLIHIQRICILKCDCDFIHGSSHGLLQRPLIAKHKLSVRRQRSLISYRHVFSKFLISHINVLSVIAIVLLWGGGGGGYCSAYIDALQTYQHVE